MQGTGPGQLGTTYRTYVARSFWAEKQSVRPGEQIRTGHENRQRRRRRGVRGISTEPAGCLNKVGVGMLHQPAHVHARPGYGSGAKEQQTR